MKSIFLKIIWNLLKKKFWARRNFCVRLFDPCFFGSLPSGPGAYGLNPTGYQIRYRWLACLLFFFFFFFYTDRIELSSHYISYRKLILYESAKQKPLLRILSTKSIISQKIKFWKLFAHTFQNLGHLSG